jgi:hypothetical protein
MKNAIIIGVMTATIFMVGCGKKSPSSSTTPPPGSKPTVLSDGSNTWYLGSVTVNGTNVLVTAADTDASDNGKASLVMRAQKITLPEFKLDGVTFKEAVLALQKAAKLYDDKHRDVHFLLYKDVEAVASPAIRLDLKNVTLAETMERLAQSAGVGVTAKDYAFLFYTKSDKP